MLLKTIIALSACVVASGAAAVPEEKPKVLTAQKIYHTLIEESPFIVDKTTTVVWTKGPSISPTATATVAA
ncbi:hypothetical protein BDZ94DRAFT_1310892 [Collybia nuda]|uniref:Uncharacterized protein n=1 Tax=Collybia nuda TaxID=64659 RepID=A0A9P5Y2P2_9AGAR|nr:hypothetical protein BDZ94DRAFT_1310892 [Collybia nuda]